MGFVYEVPALSQINHAIVAIGTDTGWIWLDPTVEGSVEWLTPFESDKPAIVCTERGENIIHTPNQPPEANLTEVKTFGELNENGELKQSIIIQGKGTMDMSFRQLFKYVPEEQFKEMILQSVRAKHGKARIDSIKSGNPDDFTVPMTLTFYITIPEYPTIIGDEWHIGGGEAESFGAGQQGNIFALDERKYPIELQIRNANYSESILYFPKNMSVKTLPEPFSYSGKYISIESSQKVKENSIFSTDKMVFKEHRIPQEEYKNLKEVMENLSNHSKQEIILVINGK